MKILYISKSIIPSRTANSIHVMKMCQAIADNGHKVILLAPDIKGKYEKNISDVFEFYGVEKNFKIKKLWHPNTKLGALIYIINIFFFLLLNKNFHLIFGRFLHGCYVAALLKNKVIFETHDVIVNKKDHRFLIFKKLLKSKYFKKLVVISKALKDIYLEKNFLKNINIEVAHDGADEITNFNERINLKGEKEKLKVGYVGHLYKGRGIETIIECAKKIDDMTFHIVGGLKVDIDYWKEYLKSTNLNNIYFYGFVTPNETKKYLNSFDILLAPYQNKVSVFGNHESDTSKFMSPLKIFEYMSHKKPIVASDLPVIREVLNKSNSILVKSDDIKLWINSIEKLKDLKNREKISNQALSDFYNYSWKNRAFLILKI